MSCSFFLIVIFHLSLSYDPTSNDSPSSSDLNVLIISSLDSIYSFTIFLLVCPLLVGLFCFNTAILLSGYLGLAVIFSNLLLVLPIISSISSFLIFIHLIGFSAVY
jgi:hypothetical protein